MLNTLFIGRTLIELESLDSTNSFAKQLLANGDVREGALVVARYQFGGRGQMGSVWHSEEGMNITCSFILLPTFLDADKQFYLNMAVSLALKDFCEAITNEEISIKWPNDIYHHNKKLGGILIENTLQGSRLASSVVGIGLNINQTEFDASLPNPTSFMLMKKWKLPDAQTQFNIRVLLEELSNYFEKYYLQLKQGHFNFLERAYTEALFRYQQTHEFRKGEQSFKGEIVGVAKDGKLIIQSGEKEYRFALKEVEFVI